MGIRLFSSSIDDISCNRTVVVKETVLLPNPDPHKYEILRSEQIDDHLLVMIQYPDCTNYEGKKILLFEGITLEQLVFQKFIDPHFSDSAKYKHPIARFVPTEVGWEMGRKLAVIL